MNKLAGISALLVALLCAAPAAAKPGDLIIGDTLNADQQVARATVSGDVSVVSDDPDLIDPDGIAFSPRGDLFVADYSAGPTGGTVFDIDPGSGAASALTEAPLVQPSRVDFSPDRRLYVVDLSGFDTLFSVDPRTGDATEFATGGDFPSTISAVEVGFDADPLVLTEQGVLRLDRTTAAAAPVATGPEFGDSGGMTIAPDGTLYVAQTTDGEILRIDPRTGAVDPVAQGGLLNNTWDVAIHPNGALYVANFGGGNVVRVDPETGDQSVAVADAAIGNPEGIEVEPPKCKGRVANIVGSNKKDKLKGSKFADVIAGLGGKDKIKGVKGNDRLCGGKGKDKLKGGPGKDKLLGQGGKDKLDGGPGKDKERQ
jgi:sugar lactone lactonase YvrE